jgi:quercetin dioxygenase-like cupin family protein
VLEGECVAIVEEQERPMRRGDFLYAPPGTAHVFVDAGERP